LTKTKNASLRPDSKSRCSRSRFLDGFIEANTPQRGKVSKAGSGRKTHHCAASLNLIVLAAQIQAEGGLDFARLACRLPLSSNIYRENLMVFGANVRFIAGFRLSMPRFPAYWRQYTLVDCSQIRPQHSAICRFWLKNGYRQLVPPSFRANPRYCFAGNVRFQPVLGYRQLAPHLVSPKSEPWHSCLLG